MEQNNNIITQSAESFKDSLNNKSDFFLEFAVFSREVDQQLTRYIRSFLSHYDALFFRDIIITIIKELVNNAVKANAKRLYFIKKGLSISNPSDYNTGMASFKTDTLFEGSETFEQLPSSDLRVRVIFSVTDNALSLSVSNNIAIVPAEIEKITNRIRDAYNYADITQAFSDVLDDSEGAGLGLIMTLMMLKNAGFSINDFIFNSDSSCTYCTVKISRRHDRREIETKLTDELTREIEALPSFPEHIRIIEKMCDDDRATIPQIASVISRDIALSGSMLKLANSAGYFTSRRVDSIEDASKIIGIRGIRTLLVASGVQQIVDNRYNVYRDTWNNAYKKAFYAQKIAIQMDLSNISDTAYLGALLSEIGKIVLLATRSETVENITKLTGLKGQGPLDLIEEITLGISHPTLGALIARKWMFSESLIKTIEFYLRPYKAPSEFQAVAYAVNLAHSFVEIEYKKFRFEMVDDEVLEYFHLSNRVNFEKLHSILKQSYDLRNQ